MLKIYYLLLNHFEGDLEKEKSWLVFSQSIFAISFFIRSCLILAVVNHKWIAFVRDYPDQGSLAGWAMLPLQFFVYDIVPYATLIVSHCPKKSKRRKNGTLNSESQTSNNSEGSICNPTDRSSLHENQLHSNDLLMEKQGSTDNIIAKYADPTKTSLSESTVYHEIPQLATASFH